MSIYQASLLAGAAVAALAAWGNWRAIAWLAALQVSIAVSVAYWKTGLPYGELIAGLCDAAVCLAIYFFGRFNWELFVWRLAQAMVLVNLVFLSGNVGIFTLTPHDIYASILEAINWIAIAFIGGMAITNRLGLDNGSSGLAWPRIRGLVRALRSERKTPPFTAARKTQ